MEGVSQAWDGTPEIRQKLRDGGPLFRENPDRKQDVKTTGKEELLVAPLLHCMVRARAQNDEGDISKLKLPAIDDLRTVVRDILEVNKRDLIGDEIDRAAWLLRKSCGLVKMKCRKKQVSQVFWLHKIVCLVV